MTLLQRTQQEKSKWLVMSGDSFPCWVWPWLSLLCFFPPLPSISFLSSLPPFVLSSWFQGFLRNLGSYGKGLSSYCIFSTCIALWHTQNEDGITFFWNFLLGKKEHILKKKKRKNADGFFLSLKNIFNLCLEVGTHLDPKSIFSCFLQPYLPLWNSKN